MKDDFDTSYMSGQALEAAEVIKALILMEYPGATGGGCKAFYTPEEWDARGETYGQNAVLIVCHDGGSAAPYFNPDYGSYEHMERVAEALKSLGLYIEQCTSWYSAVYFI